MLNDQIMVQNSNLYMDFYFKMGKVQTDGSCSGKRKIISPEQGNFFRESKKNRTFFFFFFSTSWDTDKTSEHCFITKYRRQETLKIHKTLCTRDWTKFSKQTHQQLSSKLCSKCNLQWNQIIIHKENLALITGTANTIRKKWKML